MKNTTLLFVLVFICIYPTLAQKDNIENKVKMYEMTWDKIINKRQIGEINTNNFDENVVLVTNPENIVGIEGFKSYYQNFITGFSDVTFDVIDVFGQGDKIAKHWNFKGKHTGDFFGIPATSNLVDVEGVTLVKLKNGKIAKEQDFMDNTVIMTQLGLISDPNNLNVIDGAYKAFATGDIPTVLAKMDPNIIWKEAEGNSYADGNPYIGPDAVLKGVFTRIGEDHEFFNLSDIKLHEMSNNQVLATLRYDAKFKEGKSYNVQAAHLWTLKDGKVIAFQQYVDTKKLSEAEK